MHIANQCARRHITVHGSRKGGVTHDMPSSLRALAVLSLPVWIAETALPATMAYIRELRDSEEVDKHLSSGNAGGDPKLLSDHPASFLVQEIHGNSKAAGRIQLCQKSPNAGRKMWAIGSVDSETRDDGVVGVDASGVQGAGALVDQARNEAGLIKVGSCKYTSPQTRPTAKASQKRQAASCCASEPQRASEEPIVESFEALRLAISGDGVVGAYIKVLRALHSSNPDCDIIPSDTLSEQNIQRRQQTVHQAMDGRRSIINNIVKTSNTFHKHHQREEGDRREQTQDTTLISR
ncbi:hypothetical protein M430DRAFT_61137 [Amorphotheca resinae ATCC 22711]|uniref:Uncharacterized protein n=1 Tax=Amorphotheca resinae ATCC 22711 TaxID=857342 RepID=A0A2T3ATB2_AMORE|nr:hypothetical protein M430DRAFT_61137 [Amorphotheca resinae ATCC 22711]PSS10734.1 hypothetical protein M430DRAFT_61137 [Amorphotheca resinae ATCC 22711]